MSRIDLNYHTDALRAPREVYVDKEKAIGFVSERLLKVKSGLEMELFKVFLTKAEGKNNNAYGRFG